MDIKELLQFIDIEDERIIKRSKNFSDQEKRILARTVKLNEEVGELCNEVLGFIKAQRREKLEQFDNSSLSGEFADVIITTLLLAKSMDIDVKKALEEKIKKIDDRYKA